jgi:hypothetical protein
MPQTGSITERLLALLTMQTLYNRRDARDKDAGKSRGEELFGAMTAVVAVFQYQGKLGLRQAQRLGESYTHLGVRKLQVNESDNTIAVEYDATRMDQHGVAALLRRVGIPITEATTTNSCS